MLQTLVSLRFDTALSQALLYVVALVMVAYGTWAGWRNALGPVDPRTGRATEPTRQARIRRALVHGVVFAAVVRAGLYWALPSTAFLGGVGDGFPLHAYGLLLMGGFLSAVAVAARLAEREWGGREGIRRRNDVMDLAVWVLVGGIGGSKLLYLLVNLDELGATVRTVFTEPTRALGLLGGGLVFYGGLIGGGLAVWIFCRNRRIPFLRLADVIAPSVALGQAFGRLGCYTAGCCWGRPAGAHLPWAVRFPGAGLARDLFGQPAPPSLAFESQAQDAQRWVVEATGQVFHHAVPGAVRFSDWAARHGTTLPIHPTQLYESAAQLLLFAGLVVLRRHRRFHGQVLAAYLMAYALIRSTVELFRGDVERGTLNGLLRGLGADGLAAHVPLEAWWNVSTSQAISLVMFGLGLWLFLRRAREVAPLPGARPPRTQLA